MSSDSKLKRYGAKLLETVLSSIVFAFIVGLLILNAEDAAAIRADALKLASRLEQTARAGYDRNIPWTDEKLATIFAEIDGLLYDLSDRLPEDVLACFAGLATDAKEARFATLKDPELAIKRYQERLSLTKSALHGWYRSQSFAFGFFRPKPDPGC